MRDLPGRQPADPAQRERHLRVRRESGAAALLLLCGAAVARAQPAPARARGVDPRIAAAMRRSSRGPSGASGTTLSTTSPGRVCSYWIASICGS